MTSPGEHSSPDLKHRAEHDEPHGNPGAAAHNGIGGHAAVQAGDVAAAAAAGLECAWCVVDRRFPE
ncbi:hypothetical protein [Streptomyces chiangmaiensis]|uniref:Uncharacterized protein n=1 Tax=Streptomyces chiangmaiensis TaxID=766497 RepID=A0ABU7FV41_9ACTN|nr:hypothetical protein [Streptomyces chiangmaiensis]MED7827693.1 hypothetical protein [Streptomyces chiangmaiensis]